MSVDFVSRAVELFKKAAAHDEAKEFEEAYKWYMESIDVFMTAIKYDKNASRKDMLKNKVKEIMDRAEKIKEFLDNAAKDAAAGNGGGGGTAQKTASKSKSKEEDDDKKRLRGGLEGAIVQNKPNVKWESIAGLEGAKDALKEAVIMPMKFPQLFVGGRKAWKGILLYGPPGTGKSYLAKAVATEGAGTFFSITASDIMSRWMGEAEKLVRNLFEMAREAYQREGKPSIIFIDEVDSMCGSRSDGENDATRRVKTEFLTQMQGVGHDDEGILVLAATNIPWGLDSAIRRRFERRVYIPLPDARARVQMFQIHLGDTPHTLQPEDFQELAQMTELYSGADINILVRGAMMECVRTLAVATHFKYVTGPDPDDPTKTVNNRLVPCSPGDPNAVAMTANDITEPKLVMPLPVTKIDFFKALRSARPSVSQADIEEHIKFTAEFGQEG